MPFIPYTESIEIKVIEEDGIDDNDVGVGTLHSVGDLSNDPPPPGFSRTYKGSDGRIAGVLQINVDSGRYGFACVVSRWHPSA